MLYAGQSFTKPNEEILVIPRSDRDIILRAKAILNYDEHDKLNPRPEPPSITMKGGKQVSDITDKKYQDALDLWARRRTAWMIIKSLEATTELLWETVQFNDASTWENYLSELEKAFFNPQEIARIIDLCSQVNSLNQKRIDEATELFLAGQKPLNSA